MLVPFELLLSLFAAAAAAALAPLRTPVSALSVFGVIVAALAAAAPAALDPTMAKNAAVLGLGGGKATGPPTRGVRPVLGVKPVRKEPEGSKGRSGRW